jgi:hypothetical protein
MGSVRILSTMIKYLTSLKRAVQEDKKTNPAKSGIPKHSLIW